ncbi:alpha/beta fold hydrolase [Chryseobacterium daeguense]|uniref:alpha/beta fold hydrolase n=1 Tax=Chryseobacterium daeguense TaxID=412438 RepID=UPI00055154F3|nr:alpha/beta hydrolase [Chryseobacterium daeguense]
MLSWAQPDANALTELHNIHNPVLIAHGENDLPVAVQNAHNLHENLENSELIIFPDSGYASFFQNHDAFVSKVVEFLNK